MSDDTTLTGLSRTGSLDTGDVTYNSLVTDFSRTVSGFVGKDRGERKRQKIREELVRDHLDTGHQDAPSLKTQLFSIFKRN